MVKKTNINEYKINVNEYKINVKNIFFSVYIVK